MFLDPELHAVAWLSLHSAFGIAVQDFSILYQHADVKQRAPQSTVLTEHIFFKHIFSH